VGLPLEATLTPKEMLLLELELVRERCSKLKRRSDLPTASHMGFGTPFPPSRTFRSMFSPLAAKFKPVTVRMPPTMLGRVRSMPLLGAAIGRTLSSKRRFGDRSRVSCIVDVVQTGGAVVSGHCPGRRQADQPLREAIAQAGRASASQWQCRASE